MSSTNRSSVAPPHPDPFPQAEGTAAEPRPTPETPAAPIPRHVGPALPGGEGAGEGGRCSTALLVLGLGNDILTDDAIGLHVVRHLGRQFDGNEDVAVRETTEMGLALLDFMAGCRDVVLVDSIQTGTAAPGTLHEINPHTIQCLPERTPHFLGVGETLALGRMLGLAMPERVRVFAVEVADPFTLGTRMTEPLQRALPAVIARVAAAVREMRTEKKDGTSAVL